MEQGFPYLTPYQDDLLVTSGTYCTTAKEQPHKLADRLVQLFDVSPASFQCYDGRFYKIVNGLPRDYVTTFFCYETPWRAPSPQQLQKLEGSWKRILRPLLRFQELAV